MRHHPKAEHGYSSAVSSVMFSTGRHEPPETRGGSYIYEGDASQFHQWEFRTRLKLHRSKDPDRYSEAMSKIVDGLRGDAFSIAQEVGLSNLRQQGSEVRAARVAQTLGR